MKLIELLQSPWAILPESLREMQEIYATHLKGEKIDIAAVEARLGRPLGNDQQAYAVREGGVAVLSVEGIIAPKANLFTQVSGGTSAQLLVQQIQTAQADTRIKSMIQVIDSPGGSVYGIPEWGQAVREFATVKPIVTVSDAQIASAAYWGGAFANAVYLTGSMARAGSIGVYARLALSQADPTSLEFIRGKYKRSAVNGQAPSAEYMAHFEGQLDYMYSMFVEAVAEARGTDVETVLARMADGREFIGQQAVDAGLVDGFATVDQLVEQMATNPAQFADRRKAVFAIGATAQDPAGVQGSKPTAEPVLLTSQLSTTRGNAMDRPTLEQQHAALFSELRTEFMAAGATAERARIQAVEGALLPGHEALIATLKFDGKTSGGDAALAVNQAERSIRQAQGTAAAQEAPKPVPTLPAPTVDAPKAAADKARIEALPFPERCKAEFEADKSLQTEFGSQANYTAFRQAEEQGRVRVLKQKLA